MDRAVMTTFTLGCARARVRFCRWLSGYLSQSDIAPHGMANVDAELLDAGQQNAIGVYHHRYFWSDR